MPGRFNSFQRTMLDWNDLHPYNAVHAVRIYAVFDRERVLQAINSTLQRRGIFSVEIHRRQKLFSYSSEFVEMEMRVLSDASHGALVSEMERQLNTRFECERRFCPFRFFVVPEANSFTLGLTYFHAVADAEAVVYLLREIVGRICNSSFSSDRVPEIYPAPRDRLPMGLLWKKLVALPKQSLALRHSCRPIFRNRRDTQLGYDLFTLPAASLQAGLHASKLWGVTFNDLILAVMLRLLMPLAGFRAAGSRRRMSLGVVANLRREFGLEGDSAFGLFLGSFVISHPVQTTKTLPELARAVRGQTHNIKKQKLYLAAPVDFAVARAAQAFFSLERRSKFYQKNHPLWGGITNMNLNSVWKSNGDLAITDYFRGVATGPATPLVFSITTVGEIANVGVSYRKTVFSPERIETLKTGFLGALRELENAP